LPDLIAAIPAFWMFWVSGKSGWPMQNENDLLALPDERVDFGQHDERVLSAERFSAPRKLEDRQRRLVGSIHRCTSLRCR
jgi:hypothetical protein